jgi:hypothetical protein
MCVPYGVKSISIRVFRDVAVRRRIAFIAGNENKHPNE